MPQQIPKTHIMSLDQGTTSSRCIIFNSSGKAVAMAQREFPQIYPRPGWVEHDPKDILSSQLGVAAGALMRSGIRAEDIAAIGITNQRETAILWDRISGQPLCNAVVWQCRRTSGYCAALKKEGADKEIYAKTGLITDAYFSASKIRWMLENVPGARAKAEAGKLCFGTVDSFLIWHLTRGKVHATDYTNASRTLLFNIHTLRWDDDLLKLFGIPRAILPEVFPSSHVYGTAHPSFFGAEIPITGVAGDQQSALFGQLCLAEGDIKNTYGTGCFILMNTGERAAVSHSGLLTTLTAETTASKKRYALEGSVFVAGAAIQWLRDGLKILSSAADSEAEAVSAKDNGGVYFVPSFVGLGAPYWDSAARGVICGITRGAQKAHIIRAALESIAYQSNDVLKAMQADSGWPIRRIGADGGASANNFLMQFQADISGAEVKRPDTVETTALGACYLAGISAGVWKDAQELAKSAGGGRVFVPAMEAKERERNLKGWAAAIKKAREGERGEE